MSIYNPDPCDNPLSITLKGGVVTISIGINSMCQLITEGRASFEDPIKVTDNKVFAAAVFHQVGFEDAEGSTLVHTLFDMAAERAIIEDECLGVELGEQQ